MPIDKPQPDDSAGESAGHSAGDEPADDLGALEPDMDAAEPVFFAGALVFLGRAGPPLVEAFDRIYHIALEADASKATVPEGALYQTEVQAMVKDLSALAIRAARLARQGPLDPESPRQIKATAVMVDIARDLDRHRKALEDIYG